MSLRYDRIALALVASGFGLTLFLRATGVDVRPHLWAFWPLPLLLVGLWRLGRRRARRPAELAPTTWLLLAATTFTGLATSTPTSPSPPRDRITPAPPAPPDAPESVVAVERSLALSPEAVVEADVKGVFVKVDAGEPGQLHLVVYAGAHASAVAERLSLEQHGGRVHVRLALASDAAGDGTVRLALTLPAGTALDARIDAGALVVERMGEVEVQATATDIGLTELTSSASVTVSNGSLHASDIAGALEVVATNTNVEATDVGGPVTIRSAFGDVRLSRLADGATVEASEGTVVLDATADVSLTTPRCRVRLRQIRGDVDVRLNQGQLHADRVQGDLVVEATDAQLRIDGVGGDVRIRNRARGTTVANARGTVEIRAADGDLELYNCGGSIDVELDRGRARLFENRGRVAARISDGELDIDGGRADLNLRGERANIHIRELPRSGYELIAEPGGIIAHGRPALQRAVVSEGLRTTLKDADGEVTVSARVNQGVIRIGGK